MNLVVPVGIIFYCSITKAKDNGIKLYPSILNKAVGIMQAKYKYIGAIIGIIITAITIKILKTHNPYIINILGLFFDIIGAFFVSLFIIVVNKLEVHVNFLIGLFEEGAIFDKFEKWTVIIGLLFLFLGFMIQIYSNLVQLK